MEMTTATKEDKKWRHEQIEMVHFYKKYASIFGLIAISSSFNDVVITHIPTSLCLINFEVDPDWVWGCGDIKAPKMKKIQKAVEEIEGLIDWNFGKPGRQPKKINKVSTDKIKAILIKHKVMWKDEGIGI